MKKNSGKSFTSLSRQCINWWLGYVLAQPVDFDLSVMFYFVRSFMGFPVLIMFAAKYKKIVMYKFTEVQESQVIEDFVSN